MAVPGMTIPLPGGLEEDADLDEVRPDNRGAKDRRDRPESPKRQKGADPGVVTMEALRGLLAEQSVNLLQAHQAWNFKSKIFRSDWPKSRAGQRAKGRWDQIGSAP